MPERNFLTAGKLSSTFHPTIYFHLPRCVSGSLMGAGGVSGRYAHSADSPGAPEARPERSRAFCISEAQRLGPAACTRVSQEHPASWELLTSREQQRHHTKADWPLGVPGGAHQSASVWSSADRVRPSRPPQHVSRAVSAAAPSPSLVLGSFIPEVRMGDIEARIEVLRPSAGDTIVLSVPGRLNEQQREHIRRVAIGLMPAAVKVLVLDAGITMAHVVAPTPAAATPAPVPAVATSHPDFDTWYRHRVNVAHVRYIERTSYRLSCDWATFSPRGIADFVANYSGAREER